MFENRVLRRTFGSKRDGIIGGRRKLHNEELHSFYSSPSIEDHVIEDELGRACSTHVGFWWGEQKDGDY
jgi:hypothetical protein